MAIAPQPLAGKVAFLTGAARRLGRASALILAEAGADVVITYRHSEKAARQTVAELERINSLRPKQRGGHKPRVMALPCDVTDKASVRTALDAAVEEFGGLHILVNNAGVYETVPFEEITLKQWDAIFASNVRGPFLVSREALPYLRKSQGRIIHLGSLGGIRPWANHAHYCSSKAALHMLTKVMAKALAPQIPVNCVAPGMIDLGEDASSASMKRMAKQTPMKRNGNARDVAEAVLFFATAPKFITGQILAVDGGLGL